MWLDSITEWLNDLIDWLQENGIFIGLIILIGLGATLYLLILLFRWLL
jgi:hypothetical protein